MGHIPVIDPNPRRGGTVELPPAQKIRYRERSTGVLPLGDRRLADPRPDQDSGTAAAEPDRHVLRGSL